MKFVDKKIIDYCDTFSQSDSEILKELEEYTFKNKQLPQMISGNMVGNFLQLLTFP